MVFDPLPLNPLVMVMKSGLLLTTLEYGQFGPLVVRDAVPVKAPDPTLAGEFVNE